MPIKEIKSDSFNYSGFFKHILLGLALGIIICFAFIMVFSFILTKDTNDININNMAFVLGNLSVAISVFISGLFASLKNKSRGLLTGILCGFLFFVLLAVLTLLIPNSASSTSPVKGLLKVIILFLNTFIFGGFGGVFGVNLGKRRKRN